MLFNSITFLVFFALVFVAYWGLMAKNLRWRNAFVLVCSYIFYGWWDWRFLSLIFISSLSDYLIGQRMEAGVTLAAHVVRARARDVVEVQRAQSAAHGARTRWSGTLGGLLTLV